MEATPSRYLLRLDLAKIRANLSRTAGRPQTEQEVLNLLDAMGVRRTDGDWFGAENAGGRFFLDGEVLETRPQD